MFLVKKKNKKIIFLLRILSRKQSFFLKNLTDWHDESLQCCCHAINLNRIWSFYSHWWCLPCFIHHEIHRNFVGRKQNCFSTEYLLLFYVSLLISCIGLKTNSPTSVLDFICRRVGIGKLNHQQLDRNSSSLFLAVLLTTTL